MRAQTAHRATGRAGGLRRDVLLPINHTLAAKAARFLQFAMHGNKVAGSGAGMQAINILRHQQHRRGPGGFQPRQRKMRRVWLNGRVQKLRATRIVEPLHQIRIAREGFRCGDIFNAMPRPKPIRIAKSGDPRFPRNPRTG